MGISKELLEIIACPQCKKDVHLTDDENWIVCLSQRRKSNVIVILNKILLGCIVFKIVTWGIGDV